VHLSGCHSGNEFKSCFNSFLEDHGVFNKTSQPYNHKQQGPIEGLNNTITRILVNYLNDRSLELGVDYKNWTDILPELREEVNAYRKRDLNKLKKYQSEHYFNPEEAGEPAFKIGDYVHYKVTRPLDINGDVQADSVRFRRGDRIYSISVRKIVEILDMQPLVSL
jgi:hypothetical protein